MELRLEAKKLKESLAILRTMLDGEKNKTESLVRIDAQESITLSAKGQRGVVNYGIDGDIIETGTFCVDLPTLDKILRTVDEISLKSKSGHVWAITQYGKYKLPTYGLSGELFSNRDSSGVQFISIPSKLIANLISVAKIAMPLMTEEVYSTQDYAFHGFRLIFDDNEIQVESTDRQNLLVAKVKWKNKVDKKVFFLSKKAIDSLLQLTHGTEEIEIGERDNFLIVKGGGYEMSILSSVCTLPSFPDFISATYGFKYSLPKEPFLSALERVAIICGDRKIRLNLNFTKNTCQFAVHNTEQDIEEKLPCNYDYDEPLNYIVEAEQFLKIFNTLKNADTFTAKSSKAGTLLSYRTDSSEINYLVGHFRP